MGSLNLDTKFKTGDLVWFWHGWIGGAARSGLVIEVGIGPSMGTSNTRYLVARGDLGPEWMHEGLLSVRPEDVEPKNFPQRVYPSMIAQEIVQVQPMPTGALLFYFDEVAKRMEEALESVGKEGEGEK